MMKSFNVIIVNWNSGNQLKDCLKSIEKTRKDNFILNKIIIVDNASVDNSLEEIDKIDLPIEIIRNPENYGFAKACNIGAKNAEGDFILFLNPDMLLFEDTFINLFEYIYEHDKPEIGIYGIQLLDENGNIQRTCAKFPNVWNLVVRSLGLDTINSKFFKSYRLNDWNHQETKEVDQVIGAFFLVKRKLFEELKGFDERFFVYFEELDFSKRAHDLGFKTIYVTESKAYHKGGGTSERAMGKRLFYNSRSRTIYAFKHFGFLGGIAVLFTSWFIEPFLRIGYALEKTPEDIFDVIKGYFYIYKSTLSTIKKGLKK